ncbi:MAG: MucR family transcriptional regulator [Micropepsaceae bacterium]
MRIVARVVTAYVANNRMSAVDLPGLISSVHQAVASLRAGNGEGVREAQKPAVPIKRSVTDAFIICLEDGLKFKSLKRHLNSSYGMTPEQYRAKWGLPHDYPMVAPNYAEHRSRLAKAIGLGRKRTTGRRR